ncbi:MAG: glycerate kinase [Actinomycetes bacterium]
MRVLVAPDRIGVLTSAQAGTVLAAGWPEAEVVVLPVGEAGSGFVEAYAALLEAEVEPLVSAAGLVNLAAAAGTRVVGLEPAEPVADSDRYRVSTAALGTGLVAALAAGSPQRIVLDLAGPDAHDAGAGLLSSLGARADVDLESGALGLRGLTRLDLDAARARIGTAELIGVVPEAELTLPLLGLRGITARRGHAAGEPTEMLLAVDAALEQFARLAAGDLSGAPGAGACGGLGFGVLALGGRLTSGPRLALESLGAPASRRLDLVVTGCTVLDFARRGGGVLATVARVAAEAMCPCIAFAGEVLIGGRELRTLGVEAAYAVRPATPGREVYAVAEADGVTAEELAALVARVSRSWRW